MPHESDSDSRLLLKKIKNIIPRLQDEGKQKGASNKRCMITLYAASSLTNLKSKGDINKKDGYRYFSISTLRDIAKNRGRILGSDQIPFDPDSAKKAYKSLEREDFVKFLSKGDISTAICRGDTSPVAITSKGENECRKIINELVDEELLIESQSANTKSIPKLEYIQECGLKLLDVDYFEFHPISGKDIDKWKEGFEFELQSIKMKQELRREKVIENITTKLDTEGKLLMVGESGTSKSTILMEVMCDYFDKGFKILYNFGDTEIRNVERLTSLIEAILKDGNKVLVAIDNVHEERTSPIFYVLDKLHSFKLTSSLKIILTARLPDLDIFVKERIDKVPERIRKSIRNLTNDTNFKYPIPYFTREEIKEFIRLYSNIFDKELADKKVQEIYDDTKGHPYMVQFSLFHRSLRQDVIEKHDRYLTTPLQMKAMLVCSILNIASLKITTTILEQCGVIKGAYRLLGATLNKSSDGIWKTFHTRWDEEWLSTLYNDENEAIVLDRKQNLRNAIDSIFNLGDEKKTESVIGVLYNLCSEGTIPVDIVEEVIMIPKYLSKEGKCDLYGMVIGPTYSELKRYYEAIANYDKALAIDPYHTGALYNKGLTFQKMKRYKESLCCYDKVLKIDPSCGPAWYNKGYINFENKSYIEAIRCYDKALEIDTKNVYVLTQKGFIFQEIMKYDEAEECFNKALEIDPTYWPALYNKTMNRFDSVAKRF